MKAGCPIPRQVLEKFILGFPGNELPEDLKSYLGGGLAGVIIFPRNFSDPEALLKLTEEIWAAAAGPVLVSIDQEGGSRFALPPPFTQWPSAEELGLLDDLAAVESVACGIAREIAAVGCNLDFAPMLDLHLQPGSPVTSGRSYGANPSRVGELGAAFARGLSKDGVLACAKHFPGHGDTKVDPHESLPVFDGTLERLRKTELLPFARVFAAGMPMVMTAHILLPQIDPENPATLSLRILTEILRRELCFDGIVLADDLGMGAIRQRLSPGDAAIGTLLAGADMALLCHDWDVVAPSLEKVAAAFDNHAIPLAEWSASHARIEKLGRRMRRFSRKPSLSVVGCAEHQKSADEIRARAELKRKSKN
ncbi:MAG TPA: glycoside hydrolase family 3 protein [Candidatus Acidoferrales bacterium]|nr:glycoside hydrolase family 3 protein [Candidatus Acidoferrales bacterium]